MIKATNTQLNVAPRDLKKINDITGNLYESVVVMSKRANQLAKKEFEELKEKLQEFAPKNDNLEEIFDNREQMEISSHYEKLPKPCLVSISEALNDKIYFRNPDKEVLAIEEVAEK
jgi:DNA-directed RNA polymerase subunit K/omega